MRLTKKQRMIMTEILAGNKDKYDQWESWCDITQLCDRVPYQVGNRAMRSSLEFLINKGLVEYGPKEARRGQIRRLVMPTETALSLYSPRRSRYREVGDIVEYY